MSVQFRCNRDSCGTIESPHNAYENLPDGWFLVRDDGDNDYHFCSKDCLMFWAAEAQPIEPMPTGVVTLWDENWKKIESWQFDLRRPHTDQEFDLLKPYDDEDGTV